MFPYHHLNLSENPFRMQTPETLQERWCWSPEFFDSFVQSPWEVYQILGDSGWGKTTFLFGFIGALRQRDIPYLSRRLEEDQRRFACLKPVSFCILDESQRLLKRDWKRLLRQIQTQQFRLILASHENHQPLLQHWGLRSETKQLASPSSQFLKHWIQESIRASILPHKSISDVPQFSDDVLQPLLDQANGNLHTLRRTLYEVLVKFNEQNISAIRCWNWEEIKNLMRW